MNKITGKDIHNAYMDAEKELNKERDVKNISVTKWDFLSNLSKARYDKVAKILNKSLLRLNKIKGVR